MKPIFLFIAFATSLVSLGQLTDETRMVFPDFKQGNVLFKDGTKSVALLNYDTFEEQMIFQNGNKILALASPELISSIEIEGRMFEWLEGDVFLEKLKPESVLYKRNRNQLMSKGKGTAFGGVSNTSSVQPVNNLPRGFDKQASELSVDEDFDLLPDHIFYIKEESGFTSLTTPKQLCRVFDIDKKAITKFIKSEMIDLQNIDDLMKVIAYCKNNQ